MKGQNCLCESDDPYLCCSYWTNSPTLSKARLAGKAEVLFCLKRESELLLMRRNYTIKMQNWKLQICFQKKSTYWPLEANNDYQIGEKANGKMFTLDSIQIVTAMPMSPSTLLAHPINHWHIAFPIWKTIHRARMWLNSAKIHNYYGVSKW